MDRRQHKTRAAVFMAFSRLLARKPYTQITVQNIIDEADIGRSTFYAHFPTKDLLLEALCRDLFGHVLDGLDATCPIPGFTPGGDNYHAVVIHILYHISNRREAFTGLFRSDHAELFLRYFREYLTATLAPCWLGENESNRDIPAEFLQNYFTCTFVDTVHWWIRQDMPQPPEEIARYFFAVVDPVLLN